MTVPERYSSATAFRRALEARLKSIAAQEGVDLQRVRRQVAFDRLLNRIFLADPAAWVLKGGYAMELRMASARTTKDIDLTFRKTSASQTKDPGGDPILDQLQAAAAEDLGDGFAFLIGTAMMDLDGAPYGGARYPVDARMDGRTFARFHLDAGVGDRVLEPVETLRPRDWLAFAGVPAATFPALPAEQQFAEKYHAYTFVRPGRPNSRVRDLVDMVLLIRNSKLDAERLRKALRATFKRRGSHPIPREMPEPPSSWNAPFASLAKECRLALTLEEAVPEVRNFLGTMLGK